MDRQNKAEQSILAGEDVVLAAIERSTDGLHLALARSWVLPSGRGLLSVVSKPLSTVTGSWS